MDEGRVAETLYEYEICKRGECDAAEDSYRVAELLLVVEREYHPREPLYEQTRYEGYGYRDEYRDDDGQGLVGVEQHPEAEVGVSAHFDKRHYERGAEQLEYQRYRSGGRHSHAVEHVQHHHVRNHYGKEYRHHFSQVVVRRLHYAVPGHIHHSRTHDRTYQDAGRSHYKYRPVPGHLGPDRRIQEIDRIITHTHKQVEHRQNQQEPDNHKENFGHNSG